MSDNRTELEVIRAQADSLGVKYHHRAGVDKIQEAIRDFLDESSDDELSADHGLVQEATERNDSNNSAKKYLKQKIVPLTEEQYRATVRREEKAKIGALVHCRITCMNPEKRNWPGEIISVGSAKLGTFKKYIPYNGLPYHIPKIIYDVLKEKKCTQFVSSDDGSGRGEMIKKGVLINEYNIEVLPPLTPKELDDLRVKQAMAQGKLR